MTLPIASFFEDLFNGDTHAILIVTTTYFVMAGLLSLILSLRIRSWPMVRGTLVHSNLGAMSPSMRASDVNYSADLQYNYLVDDNHYQGKRLSPAVIVASANLRFLLTWQLRGITKFANDEIAVFYKPSNPKKSYLIKPGKIALSSTIGFTLLPILFWL